MRRSIPIAALVLLVLAPPSVFSQVAMTGRVQGPRFAGSGEVIPFTAVRCFATLDGPGSQSLGFRTWETHPAGWYFLTGPAGSYTIVFSTPAHFPRPIVRANWTMGPGEKIDRNLSPTFDYAVFDEATWDDQPARHYFQTFTARGTSITQVGFKLTTDGVDGGGPGSQDLVVSIHRAGGGTPDTWERIGPPMPVLNVDCGGPKNYTWSAGWDSGEVVTTPGQKYAVHLRAESDTGTFQAFWHADEDSATDCYRIGEAGTTGWQKHDLWLAVASDADGLLIPYNKRVHKEYLEFAGGARKWSQTYMAQGRGLASVVLYAAVSGRQPSQNRQRLAVRVREGDPRGPVVGIQKIAIGNANYTGDASWGTFGAAFAPGEVPLEPGKTYALEFETIENWETLHDFRDIKNHLPDPDPGFNPYRKVPPDTYPHGTSYRHAGQEQDFDLDMQVIEYQYAARDWSHAVHPEDLLRNGDMEAGELLTDKSNESRAEAWQPFAVDPGTVHQYLLDGKEQDNRIIRVFGGSATGKTVDGGYVQRVTGLSRLDTYRLAGSMRSSWIVDDKHQCRVGYDPTGQTDRPDADTIRWTTLPNLHGIFVAYLSEPIRPDNDAISVWLRGQTTLTADIPFKADFDDFTLRRVDTGVPSSRPTGDPVDVKTQRR